MPWEVTYAGNMYHACVQCLASYHGVGLQSVQQDPASGVFRGSHGAKVASVIPPQIRTNSVYLRHYLGDVDIMAKLLKCGHQLREIRRQMEEAEEL